MISERLHDLHDVQEHLGGDKWWGSTWCRCHLNWAQYQMKSQRGRHDVGETLVEGGKKTARDISCLKVREKTQHKLMKNDLPFVSRRGWGGGRIDDEIRGLYKHLLKQQASMPSPRPKVWWAEAARIVESTQVTELTISSCSDPTQATLKWFQKKHVKIKNVKSVDFKLAWTKVQWDFHEHSTIPHEIFWDVVPEENVHVLLGW